MKKKKKIKKIEKFDLTDEQINAIDNIIAGKLEIKDYKTVLLEVSEHLTKCSNVVQDIGDVGNEIGIAIGKFIKNKKDKSEFIWGIEHGISLIDETHG